jgi:dolichol-phosphate mannosyltransferase
MVRLARKNPRVTAVRLSRNFGQHYAITAGLDLARGEWVAIMDCDLQDRPEEILRLVQEGERGADVVLARRRNRRDAASKRLSSLLFYWVFKILSGSKIDPAVGTFRVLRQPVVRAYRTMGETARLFGGMIEWLGFETSYVDVQHDERGAGKSSYSLRAYAKLAADGIFAFSNRPLYFSIAAGVVISIAAGGYGAFLILRYLVHPQIGVQGWLSTITLNAFIGGLILLNLGVIGIYVSRTYDQTKGRPLFVIDQLVSQKRGGTTEASVEAQ